VYEELEGGVEGSVPVSKEGAGKLQPALVVSLRIRGSLTACIETEWLGRREEEITGIGVLKLRAFTGGMQPLRRHLILSRARVVQKCLLMLSHTFPAQEVSNWPLTPSQTLRIAPLQD